MIESTKMPDDVPRLMLFARRYRGESLFSRKMKNKF